MASSLEVLAVAKLSFWDNKPTAILTVTTPQAAIANTTFTKIQFDTTVDDNWGGHSNTTNNSRYTCQVAGMYLVRGCAGWTANATGNRLVQIYVNGSAVSYAQTQHLAATASNNAMTEATSLVRLNVGDYVETWAFQGSGGSLSLIAAGTSMHVCFEHF